MLRPTIRHLLTYFENNEKASISQFLSIFNIKAISFKNEVEKSFLQKFADHCSQQKFVYLIRATILKAI